MNSSKAAVEKYQRRYIELRFERSALFQLIQEKYHPIEVLYPGCSIHITPAFFFPHVCFVDRNPEAVDFFSNREMLLDLVKRHRKYRRTPYIQFISQDFTEELPVPRDQFDLLLAPFTGGVSIACKPYLKLDGLILTNNHQNDAVEAIQDKELSLIATVQVRQGNYQLRDAEPGEQIKLATSQSKRSLRETSSGMEYIEKESYYIFRRIAMKKEGFRPAS